MMIPKCKACMHPAIRELADREFWELKRKALKTLRGETHG